MGRFRNALFPIVIVIILAFFASRLIPSGSPGPPHSYQKLITEEIPKGEVSQVVVKPKGQVLEVKRVKHGEKYEIGYVPELLPKLEGEVNKYTVGFNIET